jgi:hypothetical protein
MIRKEKKIGQITVKVAKKRERERTKMAIISFFNFFIYTSCVGGGIKEVV